MKLRRNTSKKCILYLSMIWGLYPFIKVQASFYRDVTMLIQIGQTVTFTVIGPHNIILPNYYWKNYRDKSYSVKLNRNQLVFQDLTNGKVIVCEYEEPIKLILASNYGYLKSHDDAFEGNFMIEISGDKLQLTCRLDLEKYLAGVLWGELGRLDDNLGESAKAQAVISRTYYAYMIRKAGQRMIIPTTTSFQVYRYQPIYPEVIRKAIHATHGQVLTRSHEPIQAFFSADCGGYRALASEVWSGGTESLDYLSSQWDGIDYQSEFCQVEKSHFWYYTFQAADLDRICSGVLFKTPGEKLEDIQIHSRSSSGRVDTLRIVSSLAQYNICKENIRTFFNDLGLPDGLPSRLFNLYQKVSENGKDTLFSFYGVGKGHGVGLCQKGAFGMARQGYRYQDILKFYFKNAALSSIAQLEK